MPRDRGIDVPTPLSTPHHRINVDQEDTMNRAQRRLAARQGRLCEHGYAKKTDGRGRPYCPHGCGFPHSQRPADGKSADVTTEDLEER